MVDCEEIMTALDECHARGFLYRSVGMCNQVKDQVTLCLRAARLERTRLNREKAVEKRKQVEERWREIDENR